MTEPKEVVIVEPKEAGCFLARWTWPGGRAEFKAPALRTSQPERSRETTVQFLAWLLATRETREVDPLAYPGGAGGVSLDFGKFLKMIENLTQLSPGQIKAFIGLGQIFDALKRRLEDGDS